MYIYIYVYRTYDVYVRGASAAPPRAARQVPRGDSEGAALGAVSIRVISISVSVIIIIIIIIIISSSSSSSIINIVIISIIIIIRYCWYY